MESLINYSVEQRIATITLNRPEKRNALNHELVTALKEAFIKAEDDKEVKVIILNANGEVFSAGADLDYLKKLQQNSYQENLADSTHLMKLFKRIYTLDKVVIACVEGSAIAGGCGLATVCDLVYAVPEAKFGYTEVKIGFIPAIVMLFLIRKIGESKARELLLTGKLIEAEEARNFGMVNALVPKQNIREEVRAMALKLCNEASGESLRMTKQMIGKVQELPLEEALTYAAEMNAKARATEDCKKGISAFINKEKLNW